MLRPPIVVIPPTSSGSGFYTQLNNNFALLADALENALDRFGSAPNQMESDLDMNSFRIINCADPIDPSDVVTLRYLINEIGKYVAATAVRWRGMWAVGNNYEPFDLVHHNGNVYIALVEHTASPGDEPGVGPGWTTYWDLFLAGLTGSPISAVSVNACPSGPVNSNTDGQTAICQLSSAIDNINTTITNLPSGNINVNACPTGPLNTNTDGQTAFCTLSSAINDIITGTTPISSTGITVAACPSGPVNTSMSLQDAVCTLSGSVNTVEVEFIRRQAKVNAYFDGTTVTVHDSFNVAAVVFGANFVNVTFVNPVEVYAPNPSASNDYILPQVGGFLKSGSPSKVFDMALAYDSSGITPIGGGYGTITEARSGSWIVLNGVYAVCFELFSVR